MTILNFLPSPQELFPVDPLAASQHLLTALGTQVSSYHQHRIPKHRPILVISNHRSFMDAPLLMSALNYPIRFACHHYMSQVPVMRELVTGFGALPLDVPEQRHQTFFQQASQVLQSHQAIGVFPEGATPMVQETTPQSMGNFQRGFAHLALRAPVEGLAVLPVAIASHQEINTPLFPIRLLQLFDATEPAFDHAGWHPLVVYQRVSVLVGHPIDITPDQQAAYRGRKGRSLVIDLTTQCHTEIQTLLRSTTP